MDSDELTAAVLCGLIVVFTAWRIAAMRKRYRVLRGLRDLLSEQADDSRRGDDATEAKRVE